MDLAKAFSVLIDCMCRFMSNRTTSAQIRWADTGHNQYLANLTVCYIEWELVTLWQDELHLLRDLDGKNRRPERIQAECGHNLLIKDGSKQKRCD